MGVGVGVLGGRNKPSNAPLIIYFQAISKDHENIKHQDLTVCA